MSERLENVIRSFLKGIRADRNVRIVRAIEDGRYVFLHALLSMKHGPRKWVATHLFETDMSERILERRGMISDYRETIPSGHDMIEGENRIRDLDRTDFNRRVVEDFIVEVLQKGNIDCLPRYISSRRFIQHNLLLKDGIAALSEFLRGKKNRGIPFRYERIFHLIGRGNFVVSLCAFRSGADNLHVFDIFRLEDGMIVEHWSNAEVAPSGRESGCS